MPDPQRQLTVEADIPTLKKLSKNQHQLQVAKSVIGSDGKLAYNVVWQSKALQPFVDIKWEPDYALNWTADGLGEGVSITLRSHWQACKPGEIYDIDNTGVFVKSAATPVKDYLAIGNNRYYTDDAPDGVHVVVGIRNKAGSFNPIYVSPVAMGKGMNGSFQPQESLQWWYSSGSKSATMFFNIGSEVGTGDFSAPDPATKTYKKKSEYDYEAGKWNTEAIP